MLCENSAKWRQKFANFCDQKEPDCSFAHHANLPPLNRHRGLWERSLLRVDPLPRLSELTNLKHFGMKQTLVIWVQSCRVVHGSLFWTRPDPAKPWTDTQSPTKNLTRPNSLPPHKVKQTSVTSQSARTDPMYIYEVNIASISYQPAIVILIGYYNVYGSDRQKVSNILHGLTI